MLQTENEFTALLVYVDNIILVGTSLDEFKKIKILDDNVKMYFLGLEVAHSKVGFLT